MHSSITLYYLGNILFTCSAHPQPLCRRCNMYNILGSPEPTPVRHSSTAIHAHNQNENSVHLSVYDATKPSPTISARTYYILYDTSADITRERGIYLYIYIYAYVYTLNTLGIHRQSVRSTILQVCTPLSRVSRSTSACHSRWRLSLTECVPAAKEEQKEIQARNRASASIRDCISAVCDTVPPYYTKRSDPPV